MTCFADFFVRAFLGGGWGVGEEPGGGESEDRAEGGGDSDDVSDAAGAVAIVRGAQQGGGGGLRLCSRLLRAE